MNLLHGAHSYTVHEIWYLWISRLVHVRTMGFFIQICNWKVKGVQFKQAHSMHWIILVGLIAWDQRSFGGQRGKRAKSLCKTEGGTDLRKVPETSWYSNARLWMESNIGIPRLAHIKRIVDYVGCHVRRHVKGSWQGKSGRRKKVI